MDAVDETKKANAINELRKRLEDEVEPEMYEDDRFFFRFLKAREFDVDATEVMLKKHLEWRKRYDVKNILKHKQPEVLNKYFPFVMLGHDKNGHVVRYLPSGNVDWIGVHMSCKLDDLIKRVIYDVEEDIQELKRESKRLGRTVDKCIYIHNLENYSFAQATNKKVIMNMMVMFDMYQNNYPERLKAVYVINASMYFNLLFNMLKNVLSHSVLSKTKIYSDDSWKEDLLKFIDADVLPAFLGGTRTDPDGNPLCLSFINHGQPVPETYYIHKSKRSLANSPGAQKVTLSKAAFHEVNMEVKEPGSYLEWEFETKCRDIGFGLFYQEIVDGEEKNTELIPLQRIATDDYAETGMYRCEKGGTYVIVFDNTYSWIRAKEIYYRIKVVSPQEQEIHATS